MASLLLSFRSSQEARDTLYIDVLVTDQFWCQYLVPTPVSNDTLLHLPKQFIWENESPQKFRASLRTDHIQRMIKKFPDDTVPSENVTTSLDAVATIMLTTTKRCLKIKTTTKGRRNKISFNEKWFHNEMSQEARTTKTSQ